MKISSLDFAVIAVYMAVSAVIGVMSRKNVKSTEDYYVAGRSLSPFVLAATVCASVIGGSALIGKGGYAYTGGVVCIAIGLPYMAGMFLFSAFSGKISRIGHKYGFMSMPEMMGWRFGKSVKYIAALMVAYTSMATVGAQISAMGTIISTIAGGNVSYTAGAFIATVIFVSYTASSGLFGVVYTDILQFVVIILSVYILLPFEGIRQAGGFAEVIARTAPEKWSWNFSPEIITLIATNFVMTIAGAEFWQRAFAAKDNKAAFRGQFWGTAVYAVTIVITMFIGLAAAILFPSLVEDYGTADYAVPVMIVNILPSGLAGVAIAGVFSVMMSSADSYLLVASQSVIGDIIRPVSGYANENRELMLSRVCNIVFGVLAFVIAMFFRRAYDALMFGWTFYAATLGVPSLFALVWRKASAPGILAGMSAGFVVSIAWKFLGNPMGVGSTVAGVAVNFVVCVAVSFATYNKYPSRMAESD